MNVQQIIEFVDRENITYISYNKNDPKKSSQELKSWKENEYLLLGIMAGFIPEKTAFFNEVGHYLRNMKPPMFW